MNLAHAAAKRTQQSDILAIAVVDGEVHLFVRDTGTGISTTDQAVIFDRFTRGTGAHLRHPGARSVWRSSRRSPRRTAAA